MQLLAAGGRENSLLKMEEFICGGFFKTSPLFLLLSYNRLS
jgi:hypothetical protein